MLFVFDCRDKPDHVQVRLDNRGAHLEYLASFREHVLMAGPTLSEDGSTMSGSVLILDLEDRAAAEAFAVNDPYAKAGLFERVTIHQWRKVIPQD